MRARKAGSSFTLTRGGALVLALVGLGLISSELGEFASRFLFMFEVGGFDEVGF